MASRTRGHRIKQDVSGSGFLNRIVTTSIISEKYDPLYYEILSDLDFPNLSGERKIIAWQIALTTVRIYETYDASAVFNDADRAAHGEKMEALPQLEKSLLAFITAFRASKGREEQPEVPETESLQEQLSRLINDRKLN